LRNLLFEGIEDTTTEELRYRIQNDIGLYFPQISVQEVKFDNIPDMNEIKFTLTYSIKSFGIIDDITIVLQ
jgi:phage baseplate assembly protein W